MLSWAIEEKLVSPTELGRRMGEVDGEKTKKASLYNWAKPVPEAHKTTRFFLSLIAAVPQIRDRFQGLLGNGTLKAPTDDAELTTYHGRMMRLWEIPECREMLRDAINLTDKAANALARASPGEQPAASSQGAH